MYYQYIHHKAFAVVQNSPLCITLTILPTAHPVAIYKRRTRSDEVHVFVCKKEGSVALSCTIVMETHLRSSRVVLAMGNPRNCACAIDNNARMETPCNCSCGAR